MANNITDYNDYVKEVKVKMNDIANNHKKHTEKLEKLFPNLSEESSNYIKSLAENTKKKSDETIKKIDLCSSDRHKMEDVLETFYSSVYINTYKFGEIIDSIDKNPTLETAEDIIKQQMNTHCISLYKSNSPFELRHFDGIISIDDVSKRYPFFEDVLSEAVKFGDVKLYDDKRSNTADHGGASGFIVEFEGCSLDIISHDMSYGGNDAFEIALIDKDTNNFIYPEGTDFEIDVVGFLDEEEVSDYIQRYSKYNSKTNSFEKDTINHDEFDR